MLWISTNSLLRWGTRISLRWWQTKNYIHALVVDAILVLAWGKACGEAKLSWKKWEETQIRTPCNGKPCVVPPWNGRSVSQMVNRSESVCSGIKDQMRQKLCKFEPVHAVPMWLCMVWLGMGFWVWGEHGHFCCQTHASVCVCLSSDVRTAGMKAIFKVRAGKAQ